MACPSMSTTTIERGRFSHFLSAQDDGTFERALGEIRRGAKTTHWMWFIFPQIAGLGNSANARKFALASAAEAAQFAAHDELGPRLFEATEALLDWAGTLSAEDILGPVDTVKLRSCAPFRSGLQRRRRAGFCRRARPVLRWRARSPHARQTLIFAAAQSAASRGSPAGYSIGAMSVTLAA
ncbi:DUF1810 family protein [Qipengyuania flava]|uniref:DUF1810 family protein n=1 Tax=Qipengyuania flava TaxID=192812 RepID=UPI002AA598BA